MHGKDAVTLVNLRKEPGAAGRCVITFSDRAALSTPHFYFHITDGDQRMLLNHY